MNNSDNAIFRAENIFENKKSIAFDFLNSFEKIWEAIPFLEDFIKNFKSSAFLFLDKEKNILVAKDAIIEEGAELQRNCIIGSKSIIKKYSVIRENVIVGDNCIIGNFVEIKNSVLFNEVQLPHFNYVGDSFLGYKSHLGAGAKISNFRSIVGTIKITLGDKKIDSGLEKFGAVLSDYVEIGCNSVLNPGSILNKNTVIYPLVNFRGVSKNGEIIKK